MTSKQLKINDSLDLMVQFIEALCHKIRTPLSVISNDLSFFEATLGKDEIARSKRRLDEIKVILKECAEVSNLAEQSIRLSEVVAPFLSKEECPTPFEIRYLEWGEKAKLALSFLKRILSEAGLLSSMHDAIRGVIAESDFAPSQLKINCLKEISKPSSGLELLRDLGLSSSPLTPLICILLDSCDVELTGTPQGAGTEISVDFKC